MDLSAAALIGIALASVAAGLINAVAGGGTMLAFPALTVTGMPTVEANITTTVALTPGYLGGTLAQRADLAGQRSRLLRLLPCGVVGGLIGAWLLTVTDEDLFRHLIPWLLFAASGLLLAQDRIRDVVIRRAEHRSGDPHPSGVGIGVMSATVGAGIYGGYFGGALGIILLAVLGIALDDDLRRINAIKQLLSLAMNVAASVLLLGSGKVPWAPAVVMAVGSLVGGTLGGRIPGRLDPRVFRAVVVAVGVTVGLVYLVRA